MGLAFQLQLKVKERTELWPQDDVATLMAPDVLTPNACGD